jgi:SAM-dependent methyltransferase
MDLAEVGRYYSDKLGAHGASAQGVDWNSADSHRLRLEQMLRVIGPEAQFSLNDLGCGYGALYDLLRSLGRGCDYLGVDVSAAMVEKAAALHRGQSLCRFIVGDRADRAADYSIACGIFSVRLSAADAAWRAHILRTLEAMDAGSRLGFAFNCLTKYSDAGRMREDLYYADPGELFDFCKTRFARNVALLHDYGLYEFTIIVRKGA